MDEAGRSSPSWASDPQILTRENLWNRAISFTIFLRAPLVARIGRFDEELGLGASTPWSSGEEIDYLLRGLAAGARIEYDPALVVTHSDKRAVALGASLARRPRRREHRLHPAQAPLPQANGRTDVRPPNRRRSRRTRARRSRAGGFSTLDAARQVAGVSLLTRRPWTLRRVAGGIGRRVPLRPFRILFPYSVWRPLFRLWLGTVRTQPDRERAMRQLLQVYDDAYHGVDLGAIDYDQGVHAKHRLTRYHDFFVERVHEGERVLDVGCGKGELAYDLAERSGAHVVAVDASPWMLEFARERFAHPNVTFVQADAVEYTPDEPVDVAVLSNVLEHIEPRVELLRALRERAGARRLLIRVPALQTRLDRSVAARGRAAALLRSGAQARVRPAAPARRACRSRLGDGRAAAQLGRDLGRSVSSLKSSSCRSSQGSSENRSTARSRAAAA